MALADLNALRTAQLYPTQEIAVYKTSGSNPPGLGTWASFWQDLGTPGAGAVPTTPAVPTRATAGALGQLNKAGTEQRAWLRRAALRTTVVGQAYVMLIDRLAHMGGLDGTNTGAQTVNTPTLTRFTSGIGVMAALEIYTSLGATAQTWTTAYDSDSGTGHTSQPVSTMGALASAIARSFIPLSLQSGDLGVKNVATIQLSGSTGTIGNFGITLYKPLWVWPLATFNNFPISGDPVKCNGCGGMPAIPDDACLQLIVNFSNGSGSSWSPIADLAFFED